MKFGIFDHIDDAGIPLGQLYAERLAIAEAYDRAGFYGYHVAEHHATPLGVAPSPGVWLAAVAQRTKYQQVVEKQMDAYFTSSMLQDDNIIDPRDTREVLAICLSIVYNAPVQGGNIVGVSRY